MANAALAVLLLGEMVGEIVRTRGGVLRLTYTDETRVPGRTPLSLSLPMGEGSLSGVIVENFLQGLLPDNEAARREIGRRYDVDPRDVMQLLAVVGKDCAGALQLCPVDEVSEVIDRKGELVPCGDNDIEARLAELRMDEDAGWVLPGEHWSLGGAQPKFALCQMNGRWYEAHGSRATSHIVKPGIRDLRHQALVEHVTSRAAALCAIDVVETTYQWFGSESALVVTRFDRRQVGGDLLRTHQEDLCQALGVLEKYEEYGGPGASRLAMLLREEAATARQGEANVARFIDGLIFSALVAAGDAHARNYAVQLDGEDVVLAPLFDVASGLAYESMRGKRPMAMSIGGSFDATSLNREHWQWFAEDVRVDEATVLARVAEIAGGVNLAVRQAFVELADEDFDGHIKQVADRMIPAVDEHATRLAARLG